MTTTRNVRIRVSRRKPRGWRHRAAAFTLLEMILATSLSLVLLGALWGLFGTYTNLFDKGQQRVEQSQLVRSLMQQIASDLRSAIQDPVTGVDVPNAGQTAERRFGLFGTATDLRMDVLQLTPMRANTTPVGGAERSDESTAIARVPELRTIHYQMTAAPPSDERLAGVSSGLVRREMDFESPASESTTSQADGVVLDAELSDRGSAADQGDFETAAVSPESAADDTLLWVPEVSQITLRYFDGNGWTSQWNSIQRKSLPVAVEIQLRLTRGGSMSSNERPIAQGQDDEFLDDQYLDDAFPGDEFLGDEMPISAESSQDAGLVHRLIVDLPASPKYRKPTVAPPTRSQPVRSPTRRVAPPRPSSRQPTTTRGTDQWIRTNSP